MPQSQLVQTPVLGQRGGSRMAYDRSADDMDHEARKILEESYDKFDPTKLALEQQWLQNIAFTTGYQYHQWSDALKGLIYQDTPAWRVKDVRNMIRPHVERRIAYMTGFTPKFMVRPNSTDIGDIQAARVAGKIVQSYYALLEMNERLHELAHWIVTCGNAFLRVGWDATAGDRFVGPEFDEVGNPLMDDEGLPIPRIYSTGDVYSEVVSPFSVHIDPLVSRPSDLERVVIKTVKSRRWVAEHFGEDVAAEVAPLDTEEAQSERSILSIIGPGSYGAVVSTPAHRQNWCIVTELWEKRSISAPEGRLIIDCGGKIARHSKSPMPDAELPLVWFRDMIVPGKPWGQSFVDNLILPQKNYNRIVSSVEEHIYTTCHARILEPSLAGTEDQEFVTEHGDRIRFNGNIAPSYLVPPPLPGDLDKAMAQARGDMDMSALSFGASRGESQGRASAQQVSLLIEQDLASKEPQIARLAYGLERWARAVLKVVQQGVKEPRVAKITGQNGALEIQSFMGADLRGNFDVSIDVTTMLPKSRTLAMQMIQTLTGGGLLNPMNPRHVASAFKALGQESPDPLIEDQTLDQHGAELEDKWMLAGIPAPPPQFFEDHDMHAAQHTMTMKSDAFRMAPPHIKQLFIDHMALTYKLAYPQPGVMVSQGGKQAMSKQDEAAENDDGDDGPPKKGKSKES